MPDTVKNGASDIASGDWIDNLSPAVIRPYLRLARVDRPIGTWLLLFPCWWGLSLASPAWPDVWALALFAAGALVMRGAGCTINDLADRKFDGRVARTAMRPIASGAISVPRAFMFLGLQLLLGLAVLVQFNVFTIILGLSSMGLVAIYPFMKRITFWPQIVLGLTFNWGALVGWAAVKGSMDLAPLLLYAGCLFWTLGYDTIYAHQDKEDDARIGLKSTALKFGAGTRPWLYFFYGVASVLFTAAGYAAEVSWVFYVFAASIAAQLAWQARTVEIDNPLDCLVKFRSNRFVGWLLLAGVVGGRLLE